jgi:hypothetical protein
MRKLNLTKFSLETSMRSARTFTTALRLSLGIGLWLTLSSGAFAASLDGLPVDVKNESEQVLCAEKDNVAVAFQNKDVRAFRIEAAHPVYLSAGMRDNFEADWTACDMSADPSYAAPGQPLKVTLYEETELWVVGYAFPAFWRPSTATVRIRDRVEGLASAKSLCCARRGGSAVLYPQDGCASAPDDTAQYAHTGYGSSFLVGPIDTRAPARQDQGSFIRPEILDVYAGLRGGSATAHSEVDLTASPTLPSIRNASGPFAMLRSMYVTEFNNDMARAPKRRKRLARRNIMKFDKAKATDIWMGRLSPSQHNTSARMWCSTASQ